MVSAGGGRLYAVALADRPLVPEEWVRRIDAVLGALPRCEQEAAWTGTRWRVGSATVAHVFGGEDQVFRITFRGEPDEVAAFEHLGEPYFRSGWGGNVIGMVLDEEHATGRSSASCSPTPTASRRRRPSPPRSTAREPDARRGVMLLPGRMEA